MYTRLSSLSPTPSFDQHAYTQIIEPIFLQAELPPEVLAMMQGPVAPLTPPTHEGPQSYPPTTYQQRPMSPASRPVSNSLG